MMNDRDFISDKVQNSGVKAPAHMDEAFVADRIADADPTPVRADKKRRPMRIAALAASVVLVAGIATGIAVHLHKGASAVPEVSKSIGLVQFSNYDQVRTALKKINERTERYTTQTTGGYDLAVNEVADESAALSSGSKGASSSSGIEYAGTGDGSGSHSETYKQVEGVDEADSIKTDGRYIYVVEHYYSHDDYNYTGSVRVFPAVPGTTDPILRIIPGEEPEQAPATPDEATPDENEPDPAVSDRVSIGYDSSSNIGEIYVKDGRLIIICNDYSGWDEDGNYDDHEYARVFVYDVSDINRVKLLDSFSQSGYYQSSRMIGDVLYLISNEYSYDERIPVCGRGATPNEISADCIYSIEKPSETTFLIVSAYDTLDYSAQTESKAILGIGDDIYCNENNLYIAATEWNYGIWIDYVYAEAAEVDAAAADADDAEGKDDDDTIKTKIFKVDLTDGLAFTAYGEVEGYTNNQYSFDERDGYLRVATTSQNADYEDVNNLYVLDGSLNIVGSVTGFAETESIKAVRYVGDVAYVITYEQTDPLFVIDLSSPASPTILGEVKISGFSTMLVPIDDNTVLGIGVNTGEAEYTDMEVQDGVKLALFDVSDKTNPKVLDSRSYVNYNSNVTYNPRALVYNPDRGDFVIPINYYYFDDDDSFNYEWDWDAEEYDAWYRAHIEQFGGMLNFRVEGGKIVETDLYRSAQDNIDRCVYVDDTVYMTYFNTEGAVSLDSVSYK